MQRIAIIGAGGAGKSTLAIELGRILGIGVVHLDAEFWQPGWVPSGDEEWRHRVQEICATDTWITDGNYGGTMDTRLQRADTVIFLDLHPLRCCWRAFRRGLDHRGGTRPDMAVGCEEKLPGWDFLWWIATYRVRRRPGILKRLDTIRDGARIHILRTPRQVRRFLSDLHAHTAPATATHG